MSYYCSVNRTSRSSPPVTPHHPPSQSHYEHSFTSDGTVPFDSGFSRGSGGPSSATSWPASTNNRSAKVTLDPPAAPTSGLTSLLDNADDISHVGDGVFPSLAATSHDVKHCLRCKALPVTFISKQAGAYHKPNSLYFGPPPDDPNVQFQFFGLPGPEWTLYTYKCPKCGFWDMYRYHLVNIDCYSYRYPFVSGLVDDLATQLGDIFARGLSAAAGFVGNTLSRGQEYLQTEKFVKQTPPHRSGSKRQRTLRPAQPGIETQNLRHNYLMQSNDQGLPPNFIQTSSLRPGANTTMLDSMNFDPTSTSNPLSLVSSSFHDARLSNTLNPPFPPSMPTENQEQVDIHGEDVGDGTSKKPRRRRNMDHEAYSRTRQAGACKKHKKAHVKCTCLEDAAKAAASNGPGNEGSDQAAAGSRRARNQELHSSGNSMADPEARRRHRSLSRSRPLSTHRHQSQHRGDER